MTTTVESVSGRSDDPGIVAGEVQTPGSTADDGAAFADEGITKRRAAIDAIDTCVIALLKRRRNLSGEIQRLRLASGGTRFSVSRELEIVQRYRSAHGRSGSDLARVILAASRGPVPDQTQPD